MSSRAIGRFPGAVWCGVLLGSIGFSFGAAISSGAAALRSGWGVDGCVSCHARAADVPGYIDLLRTAGIVYVRERQPGIFDPAGNPSRPPLETMRRMHEAGLLVVAFAEFPRTLRPEQEDNSLVEDLLAVYRTGKELAAKAGPVISTWEMLGEPDAYFCRDLPDRAAAFQKALYLGLKDGTREAGNAAVLMGGLAGAPGPWLRRAAENGLYDYTDAVNFHFYGHAGDLRGVIAAQRDFARRHAADRKLPLWITECGMDALPFDRPDDPQGREAQRVFTLRTARIAREAGVAVFMPFLLAVPGTGGHSLTNGPGKPFPAWTDYVAYSGSHPLPERPAISVPRAPSRVVVQWLADNLTCTPHKVSGTYRFLDDGSPIEGTFVVYNFSDTPAEGTLRVQVPGAFSAGRETPAKVLRVPPFSSRKVTATFAFPGAAYERGNVVATFESGPKSFRASSRVVFGLEIVPDAVGLRSLPPLRAHRPSGRRGSFEWIWASHPYRVTGAAGPWLGLNGVVPSGGKPGAATGRLDEAWTFTVTGKPDSPTKPPMAVALIDGLPKVRDGFLRVRYEGPGAERAQVRVDLVDRSGQRFAIAENFGRSWFDNAASDLFLSYRDFNLYAWGRCTLRPEFVPEDVREIQLRLFNPPGSGPVTLRLDVLAPRKARKPL